MCSPFTKDPSSTKQCLTLCPHCPSFSPRSPLLDCREERALNLEPGALAANPKSLLTNWILGKSFKHILIRKKPGIHLFFQKVHTQDYYVLDSMRCSRKTNMKPPEKQRMRNNYLGLQHLKRLVYLPCPPPRRVVRVKFANVITAPYRHKQSSVDK